ncbi:MAG TPA: ABC transporter permease [Planctomycetaceae bacterium]|nr:ABC transporter permease [Planctomycetaceae bacterium]
MNQSISQTHVIEQSQWTLILREFRKRKLAVISWWVIILLISISVFAPFLANNKPLYYRGANRFEYDEALRTINTLALKIGRLPESPTEIELLNAAYEVTVIRDAGGRILAQLSDEASPPVQAQIEAIAETAERAVFDPAVRPELTALRVELRNLARTARDQLVFSAHWPVIASLDWLEIWFMCFTLLLICLPLSKRLIRKLDPAGRRKLVPLSFAVLPTLAALGWWFAVPERVDRSPYRDGVRHDSAQADSAPVVYETVLWPHIPYALDESNLNLLYGKPAYASGLLAPLTDPDQARLLKPEPGQKIESRPWTRPHVLGTDGTGRDVLCRMIWGGRVSLSVGIVAVSIYVTIGIIVGSIAGYFRGAADIIISRIIEVVICFPSFFLILAIVAFIGPSIFNIMLVIGLTSWTGVARLVRGEFLRLSEQEFVVAGRALGYSSTRIIFRHILPNAMAPVLVSATFGVAGAILTESALSFLNLGISVPTPSWGGILFTGRNAIHSAPWLIFYPGMAIFITITAYNLVGEAFRDAADPRLRGRH